MELAEWKSMVLTKMGLIQPITVREICQNQNGIQAQFQTYADDGFKSRLTKEALSQVWSHDLVRQWSIRGTVHAYLKEEIPLYLYEGRNYLKPSLSLPSRDGKMTAEEKQYFGQIIMDSLTDENKTRDELKVICRKEGLNKEKEQSLFNAWGGIIASLVSEGMIYQEYGNRRFGRLTHYQPVAKEIAELEIAKRYFSGFGPVSLSDARYYFKENKSTIENWMQQLALKTVNVDGKERYYMGDLPVALDIPKVIFIAGFDALLLTIEKKENPFFDARYIRDIYTLTGIIKPVVLLNGQLVATWRKEKGKLMIKPFMNLKSMELKEIEMQAANHYSTIIFE